MASLSLGGPRLPLGPREADVAGAEALLGSISADRQPSDERMREAECMSMVEQLLLLHAASAAPAQAARVPYMMRCIPRILAQ